MSPIVSSLPTIGRIPAARAALWKRGSPYTPSRSSSASAEYPSPAARSTSASGSDAPCRKLKADAAWSSMYTGTNLEFGIWNLECVTQADRSAHEFQIPNSTFSILVSRRPVRAGHGDVVQAQVHPELRAMVDDVVQDEAAHAVVARQREEDVVAVFQRPGDEILGVGLLEQGAHRCDVGVEPGQQLRARLRFLRHLLL